MDNLSSHKGADIRQAIKVTGARLLYLPPYSPDFNPIENPFAKLKALLRKAAERTVDGLCNTIARLIKPFTPHECASRRVPCNLIGFRSSVTAAVTA